MIVDDSFVYGFRSFGVASSVLLHVSGLTRRAAAHQFAEFEYDRIRNAIKNTVAGTLAADEPCIEEDLKVFRYVGLIPFQVTDNLVDRSRSALKCLQDAKTARFSEHLESASDQLDHLLVDHRLTFRTDKACLIHYIIIHAYSWNRQKPGSCSNAV